MKRRNTLISMAVLGLVLTLALGGMAAAQAPTPVVYPNPTHSLVEVGSQIDIQIRAENVSNFYGAEFELTYDPAIVTALSVVPGAVFTAYPNEYQVVQNEILTGTIRFAASLLSTTKAPPFTGNAHVATITFLGIAPGTSPLTWVETKVSNNAAQAITHARLNGTIQVAYMADVQGRALMEGRSNHSGSSVSIVGWGTPDTTDSGGWYWFGNVVNGTYDVTMGHSLYLSSTLTTCTVSGSGTVTLPDVTLLGGDLNADNVIDILDLSFAAAHFNQNFPAADITANGIVDVYDIVLIGKNFKVAGPVLLPCP